MSPPHCMPQNLAIYVRQPTATTKPVVTSADKAETITGTRQVILNFSGIFDYGNVALTLAVAATATATTVPALQQQKDGIKKQQKPAGVTNTSSNEIYATDFCMQHTSNQC
ncbi:unnamed protein product [Ceratitis capitata]|uniref:(Mediterranean fruit fly) hypothetical protein n=1 Tax=Ceratitis capitata TaxID=7213 RepID=A0A811V8S6_CERCA|nr:unnamed protein product [Ceratitis capitata]